LLVYICGAVGHTIIEEDWDSIRWFNPATLLYMSQVRNWMLNEGRGEMIVCFVDIDGIVDHHCLNLFFLKIVKCSIESKS